MIMFQAKSEVMSQAQKFMFNPAFFDRLCPVLEEYIDDFNDRDFIFRVFNNEWPDMESTERIRHIARAIHHFLSRDFGNAARQLADIARALRNVRSDHSGLEYAFLGAYLEGCGLRPDQASVQAEVMELTDRKFKLSCIVGQTEPA